MSVLSHRLTWRKVRSIGNLGFIRGNGETTSLLLFYFILLQRSSKCKNKKSDIYSFLLLWQKCSTRFGGSGGFLLDEDTGTLQSQTQEVGGGGYNQAKSTLILPRRHARLPNSAALKSADLKPLGGLEVRIRVHVLFLIKCCISEAHPAVVFM